MVLMTGIDLEAVSRSIASFLVILYVFGAMPNYTGISFQRVSQHFQTLAGVSLKKINRLPLGYFWPSFQGDTLSRVTNDDVDTAACNLSTKV